MADTIMEEITATYLDEKFRWDMTVVLAVRGDDGETVTVKTRAEIGELDHGCTYRWYGRWVNHAKYGRQFFAKSFIQVTPHDRDGIVAYLRRAPGIGQHIAASLWDQYQGEAVERLRTEPEAVAKATPRLGVKTAREAAAYLDSEKDLEDATIAMMDLIAGRGFRNDVLKRAIKIWGNRAAEIVRKNPFLLMKFSGVGFARADEMYLDLGHDPARLKRQTLCLWHSVIKDGSGSTWTDVYHARRALVESIGGTSVRLPAAVKLGMRSGLLAYHQDANGNRWITEGHMAAAERNVAARVARMLRGEVSWPDVACLDLSSHQRVVLASATRARIGVFGGSPGTGKTYSAARLISALIDQCGSRSIAVAAPTGKAAVRITEALKEYGIDIRARTIHSLLEVESVDDGGGFKFQRHEDNPLEERYVIIDEASMVDTNLMADLLRAMRDDGHLLLVGDTEQLPPVGHGAPLRDITIAGVPCGTLREIRRNSGRIVATCAAIRDQKPIHDESLDGPLRPDVGENLLLKRTRDAADSLETIVRTVHKLRSIDGIDPVWDAQVIVAVNQKSELARRHVNHILQGEMNRQHKAHSRFWLNDKIVCLKNSFLPAIEYDNEAASGWVREHETQEGDIREEIYIANGELGRVLEVEEKKLVVEFAAPRRVALIPVGEEGVANFDLGYAISAHKSQGSEWPVVIIALDDYFGARRICDRSWIYTAISRAKRACILVGQKSTLEGMCFRQKLNQRKTFLAEWILVEASHVPSQEEKIGSEEERANAHREGEGKEEVGSPRGAVHAGH